MVRISIPMICGWHVYIYDGVRFYTRALCKNLWPKGWRVMRGNFIYGTRRIVKTKNSTAASRAHKFPVRLSVSALAMSIAVMVGTLPEPVLAQATDVQFSIPAQSLSRSLLQLGEQASLQIFFSQDIVDGHTAPSVSGSLPPEEALRRLLAGTGIQFRRTGNNISLSRPAADGTTQLAPVTVVGRRDATSEGTGSYAAQAATLFKGAQSLREIPQSVSVMTRQQMDDQGFTSVDQAMAQVAGISLTSSSQPGEPVFWSRGYEMSAQVDGRQSATESGRYAFALPSLAMYDRIEVLRGVSGLLTGNGEPGGMVNYVKKRPGHDPATSVRLQAGSWDHYYTELDVSRPLNADGTLRGRAVLAYQDEHKFYDVATDQAKLAYGVLEYDLTPATTLGLSASYNRRSYTVFWGLPFYSDGSLPGRSSYIGAGDKMYTEQTDIGIDLEHRFDNGWNFKAGYSQLELDRALLVAYANGTIDPATGLGNVTLGNDRYDLTNKAFDVSVTGPIQLFGRTHKLTFGYDFQDRDSIMGARWSQAGLWDVLNDHDFSGLLPADGNQTRYRTKRSGIYTHGHIKLADDWTVVLGGRWSDYESKSRGLTVPTDWNVSNAKADKKFTPSAGLLWDVNDQLTLYGSYAEIFEPQSTTDYTGQVLEPRVGWQTELGAKGEFFDGRLNASLALFRIRDENRSITDPNHTGCGSSATGVCAMAAGLWQTQGWELEISGNPAPGWDVSASYTRTMTKVLRAADASTEGGVANARVPEHLFKFWTQYRPGASILDGALERWTFGAGVYASSRVGGTSATAPIFQGGYATVSAKVGYRINKQWNASLFVDNVFDRRYLSMIGTERNYNHYGKPRNFMLTLNGRF